MRAARCARIAGEIAMELAKQFIDVGLFTNQIDEMRAFYGERIRLPYEELLPVGGGVRQYRYGNDLELVPSGQRGVNQIEIHIGVTDEAAFEKFYGDAMGAERIGAGRFKLGNTIISFRHDPAAVRASKTASDAMAPMRALGMRYITIQVRDCDGEHRRLISMGVWEGTAPMTLGKVARISMIRDPDGNFIEISQRASLTGPIPG